MIPNEVFLSHSSLDHDFVTNLANVLRRHGVPVWYSPINILGAQQWHDEIGAAFQIVDFQRTFEEGCRDLLRLWGLGYQPSQ